MKRLILPIDSSYGNGEKGFTYIGVLIIVAIIGLTLALASTLWSFAQQRQKEQELIFVGNQFRQAIGQYYERSPGSVKIYPRTLEDLLQDNRYVSIQRYLRRIYRDPITGIAEWGLVMAPEGGVMGVHSNSDMKPIKEASFLGVNAGFEDGKKYSDWRFIYRPNVSLAVSIKVY